MGRFTRIDNLNSNRRIDTFLLKFCRQIDGDNAFVGIVEGDVKPCSVDLRVAAVDDMGVDLGEVGRGAFLAPGEYNHQQYEQEAGELFHGTAL